MRLAIYGTGGAGGYFGAQLARAGEDVTSVARGDHLKAIQAHGLRVETLAGEIVIQPAKATDDPAQVAPVDVTLLGVKAWQVEEVAKKLRPMIGPETFVVPLQNGVEAASQLAAILGAEHVLGGLCGTFSWVVCPGRIRSISSTTFIKFGELDNRRTERAELLRQSFDKTSVALATTLIIATAQQPFITSAHETSLERQQAATALLAHVVDNEAFERIFPDKKVAPSDVAASLLAQAKEMQAEGLSVFGERWASWLGTSLNTHADYLQRSMRRFVRCENCDLNAS